MSRVTRTINVIGTFFNVNSIVCNSLSACLFSLPEVKLPKQKLLSDGIIAGITGAVVLVVIIIIVAAIMCQRHRSGTIYSYIHGQFIMVNLCYIK